MHPSAALSTTSLFIVLNLVFAANAQTYRRRTRSPARVIAGAIVGGVALLFFICALVLFSRRRRAARRFQLGAIPRPHVGEQPYAGPQQYGPPGSGPYMQQNQAPWQQAYPSGQTPYPSQQPPVGLKPQEEQLPAYSKEKDFANQPNNSVQQPPPIHPSGQNDGNFVGGFRKSNV